MNIEFIRAVADGTEYEFPTQQGIGDLTADRGVSTRNRGDGRVTAPPSKIETWIEEPDRVTRITRVDDTVFTVAVEKDGRVVQYEGEFRPFEVDDLVMRVLNTTVSGPAQTRGSRTRERIG